MLNQPRQRHIASTRALFGWLGAFAVLCASSAVLTANDPVDTYQWHGELVELDEGAGTLTVKARVAYREELADLDMFDAGDEILITWSGFDTRANSIRFIEPYDPANVTGDRFMLPAEFVMAEPDRQYLTFRLAVPADGLQKIRPLTAGEWVTISTPHTPADRTSAVVEVRPYVMSAASASSN